MTEFQPEPKDNLAAQDDVHVKAVSQPVTQHAAHYGDVHELIAFEIDPVEEKQTLRVIDWNIAPIVMVLYFIAFLDRSNLSNAYVGGMGTDLHFPANGLSVCASIFYATYVALETPSTIILRSLRPSRLIPGVTIAWGCVVLASGFARNYATIVATRLLLGALESALSPCLFLYMTTFYQRHELTSRSTFLYVASPLSGIVGGLVATGFIKMDGLQGLRGWQWLYIIEGAVTIAIGIAVFFVMPDNFHTCKFLSPRQKHLLAAREAKAAEYFRDEGFSWKHIKSALSDPMVHVCALSQLGIDTCLYGYATFLVVIINQLGFNSVVSQGLSAPGYALAAIAYVIGAYLTDKYNTRFKVVMPLMVFTCIGYAILLGCKNSVAGSVVGAFVTGTGIYFAVGIGVTWLNLNIAGYRRRSFAAGWQQSIGNCGGIIAGQIYRSEDAPRYVLGNAISLGCMLAAMIIFTVQFSVWKSRNHARDQMTQEEKDAQDLSFVDGDHHHGFRYQL